MKIVLLDPTPSPDLRYLEFSSAQEVLKYGSPYLLYHYLREIEINEDEAMRLIGQSPFGEASWDGYLRKLVFDHIEPIFRAQYGDWSNLGLDPKFDPLLGIIIDWDYHGPADQAYSALHAEWCKRIEQKKKEQRDSEAFWVKLSADLGIPYP